MVQSWATPPSHLPGPHYPSSLVIGPVALEHCSSLGWAPSSRSEREVQPGAPHAVRPAGWGLSSGPALAHTLCSAPQPTQTPSRLSVECVPTSDSVSPWQLAPEPLASPVHPWLPCRWEMGASRTGEHAGHPGALGRESGWRHRALGPDHCELVGVRVRGPPFIPCPELVSSPPGVIPGSPAGKVPGARPCPLASVPKDPTWPGRVGRQVLGQLMGVR